MSQNVNNIVEFTLLFNKYKKRLYNYVLKMTADRMLTDDIVQEVFIKLYGNLDLIRNKQSIQYWLFKTARNDFFTLSRNTKLKKLYDEAEDSDDIEIEDTVSLEDEFEHKELTKLITDSIGDTWPGQLDELIKLEAFADDAAFREQFRKVKLENKRTG